MARRRRSKSGRFTPGGTPRAGGTNIVIRNDDRTGSSMARRGRGRRGGRRRSRGGFGGGATGDIAKNVIAGMGFGIFDKLASDWGLPTIPFLGRKGTVAAAAYFFRNQHPIIGDIARAGMILGGYELMTQGSISGDDEGGGGVV